MIDSEPRFIQGVFDFAGAGYAVSQPVATYVVAADKRAQPVYLRAGNSADAMVSVSMVRDGAVMRLFPVGAKNAVHVQLAMVEDLPPDTRLDIMVSAPSGVSGVLVLDIGLVEI